MLSEHSRTRSAIWLTAFVLFIVAMNGCEQSPSAKVQSSISTADRQATHASVAAAKRPAKTSAIIASQFVDVARKIGVSFTLENDTVPGRFFLPEVMGSGAAWIDLDGDGWLDLFLANGCPLAPNTVSSHLPTCRMWRNHLGERFEEITQESSAGTTLYGQGCAVGDFDADGFADIYIAGYGPDRLLHNQGDGTFLDVTQQAAVSDPEWTSSCLWVDVDGDDDLDLYAVHYLNLTFANHKICEYDGKPGYCGPGSYDGVQDSIFLNMGDGSFEEAADRLGFRADNGKGLAIAAVDFDDDLVPEIYVGNDMTANFLFKRQSSQTPVAGAKLYREVAAESGCAVSGSGLNEASMGIALADFDGDSRCDIYLTHYYHTKNTLYRNLGGLVFDDISNWARVTATSHESLGFGTSAFDYDRDGAPDIFVANGHVLGPHQQPNAMKPQLLRNEGGMFTDVSSMAGSYFQTLLLGRSAAACDFDNDGDVDLAVTHLDAPFALLKNETAVSSRPYVGLIFFPRNRCLPTGGRVAVKTNAALRFVPLTSGGSYLAAPDTRLLVTWPETEQLQSLEVYWPSGLVDRFTDPPHDTYLNVFEGRSHILSPRE